MVQYPGRTILIFLLLGGLTVAFGVELLLSGSNQAAWAHAAVHGGEIAYVGTDGNLWIWGDGVEQRIVVDGTGLHIRDPRWSPDGHEISFVAEPAAGRCLCARPYRVNLDSAAISEVATPVHSTNLSRLTWAPSGRYLAGQFGFNETAGVMVVSASGSERFRVGGGSSAAPGTHLTAMHPSWSPDGSHLAYFVVDRERSTGRAVLTVADVDTWTPKTIAVSNAQSPHLSAPVWRPDGQAIAFVSHGHVWEALVERRHVQQLFDASVDASSTVAYSPDGASMAHIEADGGGLPKRENPDDVNARTWQLVLTPRDGVGEARVLSHTLLRDLYPSDNIQWLPDGSGILISLNASDQLVLVAADGSSAEPLVRLRAHEHFDWHASQDAQANFARMVASPASWRAVTESVAIFNVPSRPRNEQAPQAIRVR